jgi:hypothetical protein
MKNGAWISHSFSVPIRNVFLMVKGDQKMEDKEKEELQAEKKGRKKKRPDEELPACTTAPSAEHSRASDDDEPCDDGRSG